MSNKVSPEELARQLADTEEALVTLRNSWRVELHLAKRHGVTTRTARKWMARVRAKWRADATTVDRDARRDDMRATLTTILASALMRTEMVKDKDGDFVFAMERVQQADGTLVELRKLDKNGLPVPMTRPSPDRQRALHAAAQLRHLDALDEPFTAKLILDEAAKNMPDVASLDAAGYEKLKDLLLALAPNADLTRLAGDLFIDPAKRNRDDKRTN